MVRAGWRVRACGKRARCADAGMGDERIARAAGQCGVVRGRRIGALRAAHALSVGSCTYHALVRHRLRVPSVSIPCVIKREVQLLDLDAVSSPASCAAGAPNTMRTCHTASHIASHQLPPIATHHMTARARAAAPARARRRTRYGPAQRTAYSGRDLGVPWKSAPPPIALRAKPINSLQMQRSTSVPIWKGNAHLIKAMSAARAASQRRRLTKKAIASQTARAAIYARRSRRRRGAS